MATAERVDAPHSTNRVGTSPTLEDLRKQPKHQAGLRGSPPYGDPPCIVQIVRDGAKLNLCCSRAPVIVPALRDATNRCLLRPRRTAQDRYDALPRRPACCSTRSCALKPEARATRRQ